MALEQQINQNLAYASENEMFDTAFSWEPKRQHQFIMEVQGIPSYLIKTSAKPSMTNGEVALDMINVKRYVKGKSEWNSIEVTLYDAIVPSGAQAVMEWVRLHHESATGRDGYSSFYKKEVGFFCLKLKIQLTTAQIESSIFHLQICHNSSLDLSLGVV